MLTDKVSGDLKTVVGSYLGREPSQAECEIFFENSKIPVGTAGGYPSPMGGQTLAPVNFIGFSDNGC